MRPELRAALGSFPRREQNAARARRSRFFYRTTVKVSTSRFPRETAFGGTARSTHNVDTMDDNRFVPPDEAFLPPKDVAPRVDLLVAAGWQWGLNLGEGTVYNPRTREYLDVPQLRAMTPEQVREKANG